MTVSYEVKEPGVVTIREDKNSYGMTRAQIEQEIADLKASHNEYSDPILYEGCLAMLEGALNLLQESAP